MGSRMGKQVISGVSMLCNLTVGADDEMNSLPTIPECTDSTAYAPCARIVDDDLINCSTASVASTKAVDA